MSLISICTCGGRNADAAPRIVASSRLAVHQSCQPLPRDIKTFWSIRDSNAMPRHLSSCGHVVSSVTLDAGIGPSLLAIHVLDPWLESATRWLVHSKTRAEAHDHCHQQVSYFNLRRSERAPMYVSLNARRFRIVYTAHRRHESSTNYFRKAARAETAT